MVHTPACPATIPSRSIWRLLLSVYFIYMLAFPAGMAWVEMRPADTGFYTCAFRATTGIDCPGCGLTRAFRAMGRLDVAGAFRYNPLGPAAFLAALGYWVFAALTVCSGGRIGIPPWWGRVRRPLLIAGLAVYLIVGFGRMALEIRYPSLRPGSPAGVSAHSVWGLPIYFTPGGPSTR